MNHPPLRYIRTKKDYQEATKLLRELPCDADETYRKGLVDLIVAYEMRNATHTVTFAEIVGRIKHVTDWQEQRIASAAGMSKTNLTNKKSGDSHITLDQIAALRTSIGLSPAAFFGSRTALNCLEQKPAK